MGTRFLRVVAVALALLGPLATPKTARAYTWMIRHGYTTCQPCHADPSGSGPLTAYGRAQGDLLLRTRYGASSEEEEPSRAAGLLWGAVDLPENLRFGGDVREALLATKVDGAPTNTQQILMRADLYGDVKFGRFRAAGSLGYAPVGALGAALTRSPSENLVSRDHWVGVELDEEGAWLARAGRIALPFGLRQIEHTLWVRQTTRTDLNDTQQDGVALALAKGPLRAEVMGILGNYQIRPDDFRERGYSAYGEWAFDTRFALGVSSLFTRARRDIYLRVTDYRQCHGAFARYSPWAPLALLAEADFLYQSLTWNGHRAGYAAMLQADLEPLQGFHWMLTFEAKNEGGGVSSSFGAWSSIAWFFAPHVDVRVDGIYQSISAGPGPNIGAVSALGQIHAYL
ncbi:MAG TPA: hypothetical protein VHC69_00330 [Polyangiaceae bacterium]|nr:hypothetical protein [Polyangiaceae bacterium]